jgi:hypothetical protein
MPGAWLIEGARILGYFDHPVCRSSTSEPLRCCRSRQFDTWGITTTIESRLYRLSCGYEDGCARRSEVRLFDGLTTTKFRVYSHVYGKLDSDQKRLCNLEQLTLACNGYYRCQLYSEFPITIVEFRVPVYELDVLTDCPIHQVDSNKLGDFLELA